MLWINILMDTFAALALATEPPVMALLEQKPYSRADSIITPIMWRAIIG
jgi:magnesium-transporting ATPase (P-type)